MLRTFLRDPLVHFVIFGFLLFALAELFQLGDTGATDGPKITVSKDRQKQLVSLFEASWQRPPTETEVSGLVDGFVLEEIYYREALQLGLDKNDTIIRRRLKQKLEFLQEDFSGYEEPDAETLALWYQANQQKFAAPSRYTFKQVLLKPEDTGSIKRVLQQLNNDEVDPNSISASGLLEVNNTSLSAQGVTNRFGVEFTQELIQLTAGGEWQGPVTSVFGTHLILMQSILSGKKPTLEEVKERALQDYQAERRQVLKAELQARLKDRYSIDVE